MKTILNEGKLSTHVVIIKFSILWKMKQFIIVLLKINYKRGCINGSNITLYAWMKNFADKNVLNFFSAKGWDTCKFIFTNKILDSTQFNPTFHLGNSAWYYKFFTIPIEIVDSSALQMSGSFECNAWRLYEAAASRRWMGLIKWYHLRSCQVGAVRFTSGNLVPAMRFLDSRKRVSQR